MKTPVRLLLFLYFIHAGYNGMAIPVRDSVPAPVPQKNRLVFPIIIRSLETDWGFGAVMAQFFPQKEEDSATRTSDISLLALYTLRKQLILVVNSTVYFPHENNIIRFQSSYSYYPDNFWGLGNNTSHEAKEGFTQKQFFLNPQYLKRIHKKFYLGISYEFQLTGKIVYTPNGLFDKESISGRNGGISSGIGPLFTWDTRNNAYSPTHGTFAEMQYILFRQVTGSDFRLQLFNLDFRHFMSLSAKSVLAFQAISSLGGGDVPFRKLAELGGSDMMRGYYGGRFTDKCLMAYQAEYRRFLFGRLGMVGFASLGQVSAKPAGFAINAFHYAWGGGLRFMLSKKEKLNLRIDYGIGHHSNAFNLQIREAF